MEYLENLALPEVKAELVEESDRSKYKADELPEVKAELIYDPCNLADHMGVTYEFYPDSKFKDIDIQDLMIMGNRRIISEKNRHFLKGKKARMITGIPPTKAEEALALVTAPITAYNKGKLTKYINENRNKPEKGLCLLISFENPKNRNLGIVSPEIAKIFERRKLG